MSEERLDHEAQLFSQALGHYFQWGEQNGYTLDQPSRASSEITRERGHWRVQLRSGDRLLYDYFVKDDGTEYSVNH